MNEKENWNTCGLYFSSLDDYCSGCNLRTKYYNEQKKEISSLIMTSGFAITLFIAGIVRMSLS